VFRGHAYERGRPQHRLGGESNLSCAYLPSRPWVEMVTVHHPAVPHQHVPGIHFLRMQSESEHQRQQCLNVDAKIVCRCGYRNEWRVLGTDQFWKQRCWDLHEHLQQAAIVTPQETRMSGRARSLQPERNPMETAHLGRALSLTLLKPW